MEDRPEITAANLDPYTIEVYQPRNGGDREVCLITSQRDEETGEWVFAVTPEEARVECR